MAEAQRRFIGGSACKQEIEDGSKAINVGAWFCLPKQCFRCAEGSRSTNRSCWRQQATYIQREPGDHQCWMRIGGGLIQNNNVGIEVSNDDLVAMQLVQSVTEQPNPGERGLLFRETYATLQKIIECMELCICCFRSITDNRPA